MNASPEAEMLDRERLAELKRDIAIGLEQLDRGEAAAYHEQSLKELFDEIKVQGRQRLAARKTQIGSWNDSAQ